MTRKSQESSLGIRREIPGDRTGAEESARQSQELMLELRTKFFVRTAQWTLTKHLNC